MEREAIRRAAALDRYWDAMLRGDTFSADTADIEAGDAAILDDLQALGSHAPLVPDLERGWRELLQRPELHALQGDQPRERMRTRQDAEEMTMVQTGALPNVRPPIGMNGRVDTPPGRGPSFRLPSRRHWMVTQVATAALLAMILVAGLVAFGGWRPGSFAPSRGHYLAAIDATPEPSHFAFLWHSMGGSDPLIEPYGVGIDPEGNIWVADKQDRFQIIAPDGTYRDTWGTSGSGDGQFTFYSSGSGFYRAYGDVAFDAEGNIYVSDTGNTRVQKFAPDRTFLLAWGSKGNGDGQFITPSGIAIGPDGNVYVSDEARSDVQMFDREGRFLGTIGTPGSDDGQLGIPGGVAVAVNGDVLVADYSHQRIQRFSATGTFLDAWGQLGPADGELAGPNDVAVDDQGRVYVADDGNDRLQAFTADGQFLAKIGGHDSDPPQFDDAVGIAVGKDGTVYVSGRNGLQAFRLLP